jgi:hypothetical protein
MSEPIVVRPATVDDVPGIQAVEVAAAERFRGIEDPRIARCSQLSPAVQAMVDEQATWGLEPSLRVVMRRSLQHKTY